MRKSGYVDDKNMDARAEAWLERIRAGVAPRPNLVFKPGKAALLVVDMLHYFAHPDGRTYLPATAPIIPRIAAIIAAFRKNNGTIIYTRHCHHGEHDLGMLGKFFSDYIRAGEKDAEIVSELAPAPGEMVIPKTTYDGFLGTGLQFELKENDIDQVLITGVLTHMCCETTARSAFCRGFEVFMPVDATASNTEERHIGSLMGLADSVAIMLSTKEVLWHCQQQT
jgi:bifunctional isochorismate lyase/aryl carrier protein